MSSITKKMNAMINVLSGFHFPFLARAWIRLLALTLLFSSSANYAQEQNSKSSDWAAATKGCQLVKGLFDLCWRERDNKLLLAVSKNTGQFIITHALAQGLGSNDIGLDRAQPNELKIVEFQRIGKKVFLTQVNQRFIAQTSNLIEKKAVADAFADSVLWAGEVLAQQTTTNGEQWLIDFTDYVLSDQHGIAERLRRSKQGEFAVDAHRSSVLPERLQSFPKNTEIESLLSFKGTSAGEFVRQVAMDANVISLKQHISLLALPDDNYRKRFYHPYSGGFNQTIVDYAQALDADINQHLQVRFRLEKIHPGPAPSKVKKPIIFYLDPGTPEPIRSALLDGANWWKTAFEKAGFIDAYRVELLPPDIDAMDARYNFIAWTHRATRGWSYGSYLSDPRTGEILRGVVNLGSLRVRQDILIAEGLLAPYGKPNEAELKTHAQEMALARLRQLSAHEVGHTLGFNHNFAASRLGNGSVMDYPHPRLSIDQNGKPSISNAYGIGVGPWDDFIVQHAYGEFSDEHADLQRLRAAALDRGLAYMSDADVRFTGAAHAHGNLWDFGADTINAFDTVMNVRKIALANFDTHVLPPDRQIGELEARLVPIYLLHRYQTEAVARLIGGVEYRYALAEDNDPGVRVVDGKTQRTALQRLLKSIEVPTLLLTEATEQRFTPIAEGHNRNREYFQTKTNPLFDPWSAAQSATSLSMQLLLAPERLNRLAQQQSQTDALSLTELYQALFDASWNQVGHKDGRAQRLQSTINWVVLQHVVASFQSSEVHDAVKSVIWHELHQWQHTLKKIGDRRATEVLTKMDAARAADMLQQFFDAPADFKAKVDYIIPPGSPI